MLGSTLPAATSAAAAAAAAFATSTQDPAVSWTGWIVPRILPSASTSSSSATAVASKHQIDPSSLCPGRGLSFHPYGPLIGKSRDQDNEAKNITGTGSSIPVTVDEQSEMTSLDVYLYPPSSESTKNVTEEPLHVRMDRSSQELVNKTLHRMVLSLNKQMSKRLRKNKKQKQAKDKQNQNHAQQKQASSTTETEGIAIFRKVLDSTTTTPIMEPWTDLHKYTNQQLWKEAISTPLVVQVQLENGVMLSLPVDACPPTIVAVQTFEDFGSRVFCDVPLVVQVENLFPATDTAIVDWYVGDELICQNSLSYTPQTSDIGKQISILVTPLRQQQQKDGPYFSGRGYEEAYRFQHPVEVLPENTVVNLRRGDLWTNPYRRSTDDNHKNNGDDDSSALRVVTWNILADQNAYARSSGKHQVPCLPYVKPETIDKARRMPLILHELLSYQADVICLQEVDESIWYRLFLPAMEQAGYQGYFSTKVAKGTSEGCAMLWSLHRFESMPDEEMKYFGLSDLIHQTIQSSKNDNDKGVWKSAESIAQVMQDNPGLRDVVDNRLGHVVQMAALRLRKQENSEPDLLLVANTHLFFHPLGAHIRLMQMYSICQQFERFRQEANVACPMIVCGDLNSSLRRAAGYLLIHRNVQSSHSQIREHFNTFQWRDRDVSTVGGDLSGLSAKAIAAIKRVEHTEKDQQEPQKNWKDFPTIGLPDHFPTFLTGYPTEPEFTHYLETFVASLDHIFVSQSSEYNPYGLTPFRNAPMPSVADATEQVGMPSEKFPSDHVSLVADLKFTNHR